MLLLALALFSFFLFRGSEPARPAAPAPRDAAPAPTTMESTAVAPTQKTTKETQTALVGAFDSWSQNFLSAPENEKATLTANGIQLATARRAALEKLIQTDPRAALEQAVPDDVRKKLPAEIQSLLEERVSGRGLFGTIIADSPEQNRREVRHEFALNGRRFQAFVYGRRFSQTTREQENLWGIAIGSSLAVHEEPIRTLTKSESAGLDAKENCPVSGQPADTHSTPAFGELAGRVDAYCGAGHLTARNQRLSADGGLGGDGTEPPIARDGWTQGPRSVLFMRVAYPDDATEAITEAGAYALMDSASAWFAENSYNSTWLVTDVTPLLVLPQPRAWYCENGDGYMLSDAREVARAAGYDTDNYNLDIVRFTSPGTGCNGFGYSGQAYVGGKGCWMLSNSTGVMIHELGHNYGVWHANFWTGLADGVISHGSHVEYGNPYDVMGSSGGQGQFNAAFKNILDWLPDAQVQTVSTSGTYRVFTYDVAALTPGQNYALKIRKDYDRNYWAEFRRKIPNAWFLNGVLLNWDSWNNGVVNSGSGTHLLDTTPGTPAGNSGKDDGAIVVGRTYADEASGIFLTPVARGDGSLPENWIDVVVNLGPFPANRAPSLNLIPDTLNVALNGTVNLTAVAQDVDGDALAYAWDFGDQSFGPNSASVARAWASAGHYVVRCTASDMKGGVATKTVTITVGTPTTFRANGRITLAGQPLEGVRVHNNQSGASYRGAYTDSDGYFTVAGLAAGAHTLTAVKYGYTLPALGWSNPINVGPDAASLNFDATALPQIGFTLIDTNLGEAGLNPGVVRLTRGGNTSSALTVRLNRTGSAFNNSDYTMTPAPTNSPLQYLLAPGVTNLDITITPVADSTTEGPELITLTLIEDASYVLVSRAEVTLVLEDDEAAVRPTLSIAAYSGSGIGADNLATESGNDAGVFILTRSGSIANELLVPYTVLGSATAGVDYVALPGVVSILAGQTTALITLNTLDDAEVETNETVLVRLLTSAAYTLSTASNATVTIQDDDPVAVTVVAGDNLATESSGNNGTVTFNRLGSVTANLVVNYTLAGSAVNGSDYTTLSGTVTIPAGRPNVALTITPINDTTTEGDETVIVQVQSSAAYNVGNPGNATVVIQDNEIPTVSFSAFDASAGEGGGNPGAFRFTRSGAATDELEVFYTLGGEALSGADYDALPGSFRFASGVTMLDVAINPIDDTLIESAERVLLNVLPNPNYVIGTAGLLTVTISDNDTTTAAAIGFNSATSQGPESDTFAQISLRLSASRTASGSVNYAVTGGSATGGGTDYTLAVGTLVFPAGEVNRTLSFNVSNDALAEGDETIVITLSNPTNAVLDALSTHTYTIIDDDVSGALTITAADATASESGGDTGTFRITRATAAASPQTVLLQVLGSASAPADYAPLPMSAVIPAGSSFVDLIVVPVDDATDETNETVTVKLIPSPGGRLGSPSAATITILDNDDSNLLPIVRVDATDAWASEPGADTGTFRIARDRGTNTALTIQFTVAGAAVSGTDYTNLGTSVIMPVGVWATNLIVFPRNDTTFEMNETVLLTLTTLAGYRVEPLAAAATVTILDDEQGVSVTGSGVSAENGSSFGAFVITRTGSTVSNLPVQFSWAGTAAFNDFTPSGTNVVIPAGTNSLTLTIAATSDAVTEGIETLVLTLATNISYRVLTQNTATILLAEGGATPWQQWRALHFTPAELANATISSADADPDGDGRRNLLEYAHHKNPRIADGGGGFAGRMESTNYVIRFTRRKAPTDLNYIVEVSPDFSSWQSGGTVTQEISPATDDGNGMTETAAFWILPGGASPTQKFVRLKVTLTP